MHTDHHEGHAPIKSHHELLLKDAEKARHGHKKIHPKIDHEKTMTAVHHPKPPHFPHTIAYETVVHTTPHDVHHGYDRYQPHVETIRHDTEFMESSHPLTHDLRHVSDH